MKRIKLKYNKKEKLIIIKVKKYYIVPSFIH